MFRKNILDGYEQLLIPCLTNNEVEKFLVRIAGTEEESFYNLVFKNIDEDVFTQIYYKNNGRPNAPVNILVASLILRNRKGWSFVELIMQLKFNVAIQHAVGIFIFDELPFNEATIFNFLNRVKSHNEEKKVNLFEQMFDLVVKKQIKKFKIKTDTIRTDSIMLYSNIKKYGRVELLLEVILRLFKTFSEKDKKRFDNKFSKYTEKSSEKFIYELKSSDLSNELTVIGSIYYWINSHFKNKYEGSNEYEIFARIFDEHFTVENDKIEVKNPSEMDSGSLQSPDDSEVTFRTKKGKSYCGFSGTVSETCEPSNPISLIIDVTATANNVDDSKILADKFEEISEKRRHLRNNVEATMHEFSCKLNNHKLIVRGLQKAVEYMILPAIGINFGRINRFFNINNFIAKNKLKFVLYKKIFPFFENICKFIRFWNKIERFYAL